MVSASVGFQCPECAHQGARQQRLVDVHRGATTPIVTYVLIGLNLAVFVLAQVAGSRLGDGTYPDFATRFDLWAGTAELRNGSHVIVGIAKGEWWRVVTGGFMHANILHIAFNMFALWSVGMVLERMIGRLRFALIYAVSLLGGAVGALLLSDPMTPTVGASGAIFGVFGALVFLQMSRGISPWQGGIMGTIGINLVLTFAIPGISVGGHVGGLLIGALSGFLLIGHNVDAARRREAMVMVNAVVVVALGAVLFGAAIWGAHYVVLHGALVSSTG
jgi:membrane associated rhomboid family serine protease